MVIFHRYVSLSEGMSHISITETQKRLMLTLNDLEGCPIMNDENPQSAA